MKKHTILLFTIICLVSMGTFASNKENTTEERKASFSWSQKVVDFGTIKKDQPATATFTFKNNGNQPLLIMSVKGSCGCTVADYTKGEIPAGQNGEVTATYNAAKVGAFNKTVTVNANTEDGPITLMIKGEVVE